LFSIFILLFNYFTTMDANAYEFIMPSSGDSDSDSVCMNYDLRSNSKRAKHSGYGSNDEDNEDWFPADEDSDGSHSDGDVDYTNSTWNLEQKLKSKPKRTRPVFQFPKDDIILPKFWPPKQGTSFQPPESKPSFIAKEGKQALEFADNVDTLTGSWPDLDCVDYGLSTAMLHRVFATTMTLSYRPIVRSSARDRDDKEEGRKVLWFPVVNVGKRQFSVLCKSEESYVEFRAKFLQEMRMLGYLYSPAVDHVPRSNPDQLVPRCLVHSASCCPPTSVVVDALGRLGILWGRFVEYGQKNSFSRNHLIQFHSDLAAESQCRMTIPTPFRLYVDFGRTYRVGKYACLWGPAPGTTAVYGVFDALGGFPAFREFMASYDGEFRANQPSGLGGFTGTFDHEDTRSSYKVYWPGKHVIEDILGQRNFKIPDTRGAVQTFLRTFNLLLSRLQSDSSSRASLAAFRFEASMSCEQCSSSLLDMQAYAVNNKLLQFGHVMRTLFGRIPDSPYQPAVLLVDVDQIVSMMQYYYDCFIKLRMGKLHHVGKRLNPTSEHALVDLMSSDKDAYFNAIMIRWTR
jgi:hypothetical protein